MWRLSGWRLALLGISTVTVSPSAGHACSKVGFPGTRSSRTAHIIGTATTDSVFAGPGSVRFVVGPGHSGPGRDRTVFGQIVMVERIGGLAAAGLRQPVDRVVLVPWDYGADCTPTPWTRSTLWVDQGTRGLFMATLRDSAHWTGGLPTFDIMGPEFQPYPQQVARHRGRTNTRPVVSADTLFELMELFPDERLLRTDSAEAAVQPLLEWARAHPELASRYPMDFAINRARNVVADARRRRIVSPFRGTWRFTISTADAPSRTFYARTGPWPVTGWSAPSRANSPRDPDPTSIPAYDGYYLLLRATSTADSLPTSCGLRGPTSDGYIAVLAQPTDTAGRRVWSANIELDVLTRMFPGDSSLARFARDHFEQFRRRSEQGLSMSLPIRFTEPADSVAHIEQVNTTADGRRLVIQGTRVSTTTTTCWSG